MSTAQQSISKVVEEQTNIDNAARLEAMRRSVRIGNLIPPTVSFESRGVTLVVGEGDAVSRFAASISSELCDHCTFLYLDDSLSLLPHNIQPYHASSVRISGFLGAFDVLVTHNMMEQNLAQIALGSSHFDLVVDLTKSGLHGAERPPLGYHAVGRGLMDEAEAIAAISDTVGTFDKPKYFRLDTDKCAHFSRGIEGCTRCIDACSADALESVKNKITINPYLCQGLGSCSTACPTEAISYALPEAEHTQQFVHQLLGHYSEAGGAFPSILFYAEADEAFVDQHLANLPSNLLPVRLEELASVGIDTWFSAIASGASQVLLLETDTLHPKTRNVLEGELAIASSFLSELAMPALSISLFNPMHLSSFSFISRPATQHLVPVSGNKRDRLTAALDALSVDLERPIRSDVPQGAPFGRIEINTQDCTLCMGCVAVCPTDALNALGDTPGIAFREQDCVQCGLCEKSCPESVIALSPGFNWDTESRQTRTVIHQEAAAECISCGKPYAPASMVNMLIEKLRSHSHFQDDAIKRLSMCEDCRVRDIVSDLAEHPEKQLKL
ncbi:4Fe-4S binding protein [Enterovibrio sp. ZSDZ35]|uniref:4Fe-4S binding protein n=1 Tax=Enterovibrio qingdaonensis TaxID=2899818 RepID=A0ABT5QRX1_9GAMM|nr:4Fe-4S dicluster domain-containing protein [Enterovibrio sp. ZSDZ35]MDD1783046.1 4Fe-4S binding protein [Enterovibrio sp. ZSDZ35]